MKLLYLFKNKKENKDQAFYVANLKPITRKRIKPIGNSLIGTNASNWYAKRLILITKKQITHLKYKIKVKSR